MSTPPIVHLRHEEPACRDSLEAANIAGSKEPNKNKVGKVTRKQVMDIVKTKGKDLNSRSDEAGFKIIAGTARQMGRQSSTNHRTR